MQSPTGSKPSLPYLVTPKVLFRLGISLVLGAVAFFLRYSVEQGWIGDLAKVGMAAAAGLAMIVTGIQIAPRRPGYGNTLQGGGGAVLYLTAFATHQRYELTDTTGAFLMLVGISTAVVGMAIRQRSEPLAIAGVTGALAAPVVVGGNMGVFPGDAGYLVAVLIIGSALYLRNRWKWLFVSSVVGVGAATGVELVTLFFGAADRPAELQVAVTALWLLGCGVALLAAVRYADDPIAHVAIPLGATVLVPPAALIATLAIWDLNTRPTLWAAISFGVGAIHLIAFAAFRSQHDTIAAAQLVPAALTISIGWLGSLEGVWILFAIALQSAAMIVAGVRSRVPLLADLGHVGAGLTGIVWVVFISVASGARFDEVDILTGLVVLIAATVAFSIREADRHHATFAQVYGSLSLVAALVWAMVALGDVANGAGLVTGIWAAIGFGVLVWGRLSETGLVRNVGIGVVLLAVTKLLVIDTSTSAPLVRIGLFAGIGTALLAVAYWLASDEEPAEEPEASGATVQSSKAPDPSSSSR